MIEGRKSEPMRRRMGFVPGKRRAVETAEEALDAGRTALVGFPEPSAAPAPGSPSPRFRRNESGVLASLEPCPGCRVRGTLYYRRRFGTWRCTGCECIFSDGRVTRGEFQEVHDVVRDLKMAVKHASERFEGDDFKGGAEALRTALVSSLRGLEILTRQGRALAEERARAGP